MNLFSSRRLSSQTCANFTFFLTPGILLNWSLWRRFVCLLQEDLHAFMCSPWVTYIFLYGYVRVFPCDSPVICIYVRGLRVWQQSLVLHFTSPMWTFTSLFRHISHPWIQPRTYLSVESIHIYLLPRVLQGHFEDCSGLPGCPEVTIYLSQKNVESRGNLEGWALPGPQRIHHLLSDGEKSREWVNVDAGRSQKSILLTKNWK